MILSRLLPHGARLTVLCLIVIASVATAADVKVRPAPSTVQTQEPPAASPDAQGKGHKEELPGEVVTITPRGFEPDEVARPHGRFFLVVENRSGQRGLTLVLDAARGERVREYTQPEDELDWAEELNLSPGRYTLSVAGRPGWVCRFNVTPR